jgi:chlorite dismutase
LPGTDRDAFDTRLQAAIVFGRSIYHHLQTVAAAPGADEAYRHWFRAKSTEMKADPVLEYFRDSRDLLLKERQVAVRRRSFVRASDTVYISDYAELTVTRRQPRSRRSLGFLWQDAKAIVMMPLHRLRHRFVEAVKQRRRVLGQTVEARQTRRRNRKVVPTVREFYLDDPEGLDRPAVDLVRAYLDRLEAIVAEAEARFPMVVG